MYFGKQVLVLKECAVSIFKNTPTVKNSSTVKGGRIGTGSFSEPIGIRGSTKATVGGGE
jgi:uncharacterized membrane protein